LFHELQEKWKSEAKPKAVVQATRQQGSAFNNADEIEGTLLFVYNDHNAFCMQTNITTEVDSVVVIVKVHRM
jgi:hypothetical protein